MPLTTDEKRARHKAQMRRYRKLHPDRQEESRRYWLKNKEKILAKRKTKPLTEEQLARQRERQRTYTKRYYRNNTDKIAAKAVANRWKTRPQQKALAVRKLEAKAGRPKPAQCEICNGSGRIHFDHCHQSGMFRGWICNSCNVVLGYVRDDPNHLRLLITYLEQTTTHASTSFSILESDPASL